MNSYQYFLALVPGLTNVERRALIAAFGSEEEVFKAGDEIILKTANVKDKGKKGLLSFRRTFEREKAFDRLQHLGIRTVTFEEAGYPKRLLDVYNPPYLLYYKGTLPEEDERPVAMVGSRQPSEYGKKQAYDLAKLLSDNGFPVVSGMALGIDGYAHRGALAGTGRTYAVLGNGLDICYPARNGDIYQEIIRRGCLFSELPPGTPPLRQNFPTRNRLISGLSSALVVVEARERSGSLITADFALEQGKDIYAIPGRTSDPMSLGTNLLIYQGANIIVSGPQLIADLVGLPESPAIDGKNRLISGNNSDNYPALSLENDEMVVYSVFDFYPKNLETACEEAGFSPLSFLSIVMRLCDRGLLKETFKNEYVRC